LLVLKLLPFPDYTEEGLIVLIDLIALRAAIGEAKDWYGLVDYY
jgi:fumarate reductase subunit C